jgi:glycosyltransferase involved in cell wall biosynthesis
LHNGSPTAGVPAERIHVIPSGVIPADFEPARPDPFAHVGRPRVLFLGRLHRQKGAETLFGAVSRMRSGADVLVVGDGPERSRLEAAVTAAGLGDRVHFAGFRPHHEVASILAHADVFAMPSVYEELGTALLEAMAAGLPIVASDTGGIPGAAGGAARLVPPGDPVALAAALDDLLAHPAEAARLGALARERAADFDWDGLADQVLDVYAHALHGETSGGAARAAPAPHPVRA